MTATNHAVTGVAIAVLAREPILALPLALVAHFIMDAIPHFDIGPSNSKLARNVAFADVGLAGLLTAGLVLILEGNFSAWLIVACAFLCVSPDIVWGWRYFLRRDYREVLSEPMSSFTRWHIRIQRSESRRGISVEIVWLGLMLGYILARYHFVTSVPK